MHNAVNIWYRLPELIYIARSWNEERKVEWRSINHEGTSWSQDPLTQLAKLPIDRKRSVFSLATAGLVSTACCLVSTTCLRRRRVQRRRGQRRRRQRRIRRRRRRGWSNYRAAVTVHTSCTLKCLKLGSSATRLRDGLSLEQHQRGRAFVNETLQQSHIRSRRPQGSRSSDLRDYSPPLLGSSSLSIGVHHLVADRLRS